MNTRKQILVMSALMMMSLIGLAIYAAWYPSRQTAAEVVLDEKSAMRGSILFARNCRLCHGDVGEGGALGARLVAAPALDRPDLQGFTDVEVTLTAEAGAGDATLRVSESGRFRVGQTILVGSERMRVKGVDATARTLSVERALKPTEAASHAVDTNVLIQDKDALANQIKLITNTIVCGRVGTGMPLWGQSQGGPLSDEQVRQLMIVITQGRWDLVREEVDHEDKLNVKLLADLSEDSFSMRVSDVTVFTEKEAIRIGDERLRVTAVPKVDRNAKDKSGIIHVERGILGTTPLPHALDEPIFMFPAAAEPAVLQSACGQTARPQAPQREPRLLPDPFDGQTVEIVARGVVFDVAEIRVRAGGQLRVRLDNQDVDVDHNIAFYRSSTDLTPVAAGSVGIVYKGGPDKKDDTAFEIPPPGTYFFRCDVHPTTMTGRFIVTP